MQKTAFRLLYILILWFAGTGNSHSQNLTQSPYSIIGPGELIFGGSTFFSSLGQAAQGIRKPYQLNSSNPASYSGLAQSNIEAGGMVGSGKIYTGTQTNEAFQAGLSYFTLGAQLWQKRGLGFAMGVSPYTSVGYSVSSTSKLMADTVLDINTQYAGNGGLTKAHAGFGVRLGKYVSAGITANYLFGQINASNLLIYPSYSNRFNVAEDRINYVKGFLFEYGLQFHADTFNVKWSGRKVVRDTVFKVRAIEGTTDTIINKRFSWQDTTRLFFNAGLTFNNQSALDVSQVYALRTIILTSPSFPRDTINSASNLAGQMLVPFGMNIGMSTGVVNKWMLAADAGMTAWKDYTLMGKGDSLRNSLSLRLGASYLPNFMDDERNYLKRIEYRAGFRYEQTNLVFGGQGLNLMGISLGFGLPVSRDDRYKKHSRINLGIEYYTLGADDTKLVREEYIRFSISIVFTDRWFVRYRYD